MDKDPTISFQYQHVFNRLKKLENSLKNICRQNTELQEANSKLRKEIETRLQTEIARERVLQELEQKYAHNDGYAARND